MKLIIPIILGFSLVSVFIGYLLIAGKNVDTDTPQQETINCIKWVKYRNNGAVDVCKSSFSKLQMQYRGPLVGGAGYDQQKLYMIIQLRNTNYHYCGVTHAIWDGLSTSQDLDSYYSQYIRGKFDCRYTRMPKY